MLAYVVKLYTRRDKWLLCVCVRLLLIKLSDYYVGIRMCVYVCIYVYVYVCMCVCVYVCMCVCVYVCVFSVKAYYCICTTVCVL